MKYCCYCGSELTGTDVVFCTDCGKKLPPHEADRTEPLTEEMRPESKPKKPKPDKKPKKEKKKPKEKVPAPPEPVEDNYDGYYDDVLPPDLDRVREGVDKALVKKIVALGIGAILIISLCIVMMYVL